MIVSRAKRTGNCPVYLYANHTNRGGLYWRQTAFGENRRETIPTGPCRDAYKPGNVSVASKPGARNPKSGGMHDRNLRDCNVQDRVGFCVIRGTIEPYGKCREESDKAHFL